MANTFGSLVFTPVVKELQQRYGGRRQYERLAAQATSYQRLGPDEREFIAERDSFYMASIGSTGWPYVQHRGGPKGFLKTLDNQTIGIRRLSGEEAVHQYGKSPDG
jgi:predicted pyridoxine 5'-phosphate oxidase superfamily flavin-nucleotide-binding protein